MIKILTVVLMGLLVSVLFQCKDKEPEGYSEEFHDNLTKRLKEEGFQGSYVLIKRGKSILYNSSDRKRRFEAPGFIHLVSCIRILRLQEEGILNIQDPIGNYIQEESAEWERFRSLPIQSFMNHTSGMGTNLEPGGYWNYSWSNLRLLFRLTELYKETISKKGESIYQSIPNPFSTSIQEWIDFEIAFTQKKILTEESMDLLAEPTVLEDNYATNRFNYGLGVYSNGSNYWAITRTNSDSFLYYRIPEEEVAILIHTRGKRSRGDMLSWKSTITEAIYNQKYIDFSPWMKIPTLYKELSTVSLEDELKRRNVPAVSIAIVEDFRITKTIQMGVLDSNSKTPISEKTLFRAGSLSKSITALTAQLILDEKGIQDSNSLNDLAQKSGIDLSYWLPIRPSPKLTPFHLMTHSSGITERSEWSIPLNEKVKRLRDLNSGKGANLRVYYLPGTKSRYSGGGFALLQEYIIELTGQEFDAITKARIFDPIQMKSSFWKVGLPDHDYVSGHDENGNPIDSLLYSAPEWGAGGLWTRPEDLAIFFTEWQKCLQPEMICRFPKSVVKELVRPVIPASNLSVQSWMGKGIFINTSGKGEYLYHGGHSLGHKSTAIFHKTKGYGIVIMTNSEGGSPLIWNILRSISLQKKWDKFIN